MNKTGHEVCLQQIADLQKELNNKKLNLLLTTKAIQGTLSFFTKYSPDEFKNGKNQQAICELSEIIGLLVASMMLLERTIKELEVFERTEYQDIKETVLQKAENDQKMPQFIKDVIKDIRKQ